MKNSSLEIEQIKQDETEENKRLIDVWFTVSPDVSDWVFVFLFCTLIAMVAIVILMLIAKDIF